MMLVHVYFNRKSGDVLVPTSARTEAGYWLDVEPVERASIRDPVSISDAVRKTLERSGAVVPTPSRSSFPKPVVLSYTNKRGWSDFEKAYAQISIIRSTDGIYSFERYKPVLGGLGVEVDPEPKRASPLAETLEAAISELLTLISVPTAT